MLLGTQLHGGVPLLEVRQTLDGQALRVIGSSTSATKGVALLHVKKRRRYLNRCRFGLMILLLLIVIVLLDFPRLLIQLSQQIEQMMMTANVFLRRTNLGAGATTTTTLCETRRHGQRGRQKDVRVA